MLVSDQPMILQGVKTASSDKITRLYVERHLKIGIDSLKQLINKGSNRKGTFAFNIVILEKLLSIQDLTINWLDGIPVTTAITTYLRLMYIKGRSLQCRRIRLRQNR